ncbi:EF-hand domain-containing protein [uncultured Roseovarius sp.]|uniref:EF-hand domain-containing protein n=1 Tax=uncultured Roseovarius sp. TaxID=293344 RepID=UPI002629A41B|nr:EF-hand domain-containing protein [uncultured Roseovarius sp.]
MLKELTAATFAIALTLPAAALASDAMDADGDGLVSAEEFAAANPDAAEGTFEQIDTNADGALADDEISAARDAGVLPDAS